MTSPPPTGVLDLFIDDAFVKFREMQLGKGGLLKGQELASTFSFLRPNDLVWNYVVGNYLRGETPPPFDLLYWNSDSTNLPGPMYSYYLRNTYQDNKLCKPDALEMLGGDPQRDGRGGGHGGSLAEPGAGRPVDELAVQC